MLFTDCSGNMSEVERKIYADYSRSYRGYDGMEYTTDDTDFYFTDENGNAYSALNDATHYFGKELEQYTLTSSDGNTITVTETTNGDYYYRDDNGTGYSNNGDGTWTDVGTFWEREFCRWFQVQVLCHRNSE